MAIWPVALSWPYHRFPPALGRGTPVLSFVTVPPSEGPEAPPPTAGYGQDHGDQVLAVQAGARRTRSTRPASCRPITRRRAQPSDARLQDAAEHAPAVQTAGPGERSGAPRASWTRCLGLPHDARRPPRMGSFGVSEAGIPRVSPRPDAETEGRRGGQGRSANGPRPS